LISFGPLLPVSGCSLLLFVSAVLTSEQYCTSKADPWLRNPERHIEPSASRYHAQCEENIFPEDEMLDTENVVLSLRGEEKKEDVLDFVK
jgi:hypothetical protein